MPEPPATHRLAIEATAKRAFATAMDWPGWSRGGKTEDAAIAALATFAPRFAALASRAGLAFPVDARFEVVLRVPGSAHTEFGVPGAELESDRSGLDDLELQRSLALVVAAWQAFDAAAAAAPPELRKGPRGGGRDRDKVAAHVFEAEGAYAGMLGLKLTPPAPTDRAGVTAHRARLLEALRDAASDPAPEPGSRPKRWTFRYAARRIAWHAVDHAWEIEDRTEPRG